MDLSKIFKAYDVRGIFPTQLNEDIARRIGRSFAQCVEGDTILIGHDMRSSSPMLSRAFAEGVCDGGKNVEYAGLMSTDASYFAAGKFDMPVAMFTASHNPAQWNGIKMTNSGATPIGAESGLKDIQKTAEEGTFVAGKKRGKITERDITNDFVEHAISMIDVKKIKPLKIAVDAGNGMGGFIVPKVFARLPVTLIPLYFELDGTMPNHEPNPIDPKNVQDLIATVKKEECDIGLAFDGDADRVFFVDELGNRISASLVGAMVAENMLQKNPGATMIYNVVCSDVVKETIERNGGTAVMERVGHSYIKKTMKDTGAIFAAEHSGHYYFSQNFRADSGLIAALIVLEMLSVMNVPFSEALKKFQTYSAIEETNSEVVDKDAVIEKLKAHYTDAVLTEFDGVTFRFPDFWFNVRPSNTEPVLRLNLEAKTAELRDQKTAEVLSMIRS
ncbi:MAG: phosphomannomutase/phosphoglucomutase [Candidatus Kerfeldbacteria bacterium]|nr:phosphomannomutase/phosphoglucomutase [Candidatus Kerfeldbacteria bacterium]